MRRLTSYVIFILLGITNPALSQQTNNWYFGSPTAPGKGLRIDFTSGSPVVTRNYPIATEEGSSSISNASGTPLFYTDGVKIWDASTNTTFSTSLLGGSSSTQSAIVMPKPGATNEWLVFTSGQTSAGPPPGTQGINYYTVSGTPGSFSISAATNLVPAYTVGEGLFIIGSTKAGSSFWVITRETGNSGNVRAFDVSNTGVVNPTPEISQITGGAGFTQTNYTSHIGTIKSNTCQNQLAFTYFNGHADLVNFDTGTGRVLAGTAKRINVPTPVLPETGSYGLEFSSNDKYLYITNLGGKSLTRYDITSGITTSAFGTTSYEAGQLQMAPDGNIYMAITGDGHIGAGYLGVISNPGNAGAIFTADGLQVTTDGGSQGYSYRGLPTFPKSLVVSNPVLSPGNSTVCSGVSTKLDYLFGGSASSQTWTISPGSAGVDYSWVGLSTANDASPNIKFNNAGTYTITLTITDACSRNYTKNMTFTVLEDKIPSGTISCSGTTVTLTATGAVPADYSKYIWLDASNNPLGVGSPFTLNYSLGSIPPVIKVAVGSSASISASGINRSVGPTSTDMGWNGSTITTAHRFSVLTNQVYLKSFIIKPSGFGQFAPTNCNNISFTAVIKSSGGATIFSKAYNFPTNTCDQPITVTVNTTIPKGNNYTIQLTSLTAGAVSSWLTNNSFAGSTDAGIFTHSGPSGDAALGNFIFDYKTFATVVTCTDTVPVSGVCTLPVELVSFKGIRQEGKVVLNWTTASEINNDYFVLEKSYDGINFEAVAKVDGNGTTKESSHYTYIDDNSYSSITYYRLVQYDFNGSSQTENPIVVDGTTIEKIQVYPNPSSNNFKIFVPNTKESSSITVIDVLGRVIYSTETIHDEKEITFGDGWLTGHYILQWISGANSQTIHLIKD